MRGGLVAYVSSFIWFGVFLCALLKGNGGGRVYTVILTVPALVRSGIRLLSISDTDVRI